MYRSKLARVVNQIFMCAPGTVANLALETLQQLLASTPEAGVYVSVVKKRESLIII